jgi:hypothetical protein
MNTYFTMTEFSELDIYQKSQVLYCTGIFLSRTFDKTIMTNLYSLNDFYVEVVIQLSKMHVVGIHEFNTVERLDKYLKDVRLPVA